MIKVFSESVCTVTDKGASVLQGALEALKLNYPMVSAAAGAEGDSKAVGVS
jgi:hypothetical protein